MEKFTVKTKESLNGFQVEFTIGVQTFSLQEIEPNGFDDTKGKAEWYEKQLEYAFSKLFNEEWKIENVKRYYYASGRNHWTYKEITFWYEAHTAQRKETVRQETIITGGEWDLPEWAKCITNRNLLIESGF